MVSDRMTAVLGLLNNDQGRSAAPRQAVAELAADALGVDGIRAGLGVGPSGVVVGWGRERVSVALEDLQFTLGQGPGSDAAAGMPVLIPDLLGALARWPVFVPAAIALGVRAVFTLPLRIGAISVGALVAHRARPGPLAPGSLADALALAEALTVLLIQHQSAGTDPDAGAGGDSPVAGESPATYRSQVHQATGMISVQLGVNLAEALVRLRAHAYAEGRLIGEIAADVVARRLRFDDPGL